MSMTSAVRRSVAVHARHPGEGAQMPQACDPVRARRFPIEARLRFRSVGDPDWREGRTLNLSHSGVLFAAPSPLPGVASPIEFTLFLPSLGVPGNARVHCHGRVVRHTAADAACRAGLAATIEQYEFLGPAPPDAPVDDAGETGTKGPETLH